MTDTPWCYMPPEMHFSSPKDLKDAFGTFQLSRVQDYMNNPQMSTAFLPPPNKFEKVRNDKGKYILIPTTIDHSFVFRGQTEFHDPCLPTLYRKELTEVEELLERLRCCEFEVYLKQLPQVKAFEQNNFSIDYLGLAQHYGLKTEVIDFTNSLDVALFFAMCNMSPDEKTFTPQQEDKEYVGYIYAVGTTEFGQGPNEVKSLFDGRLTAIGMQPFYRPGSQRGFGLHMEKGESMTGLLYSFSYTKSDSEFIHSSFLQGDVLWHEDDISMTAREIRTSKLFSYTAMNLAFKRYYKRSRQEQQTMKRNLKAMGCSFCKHSPWEICNIRLQALNEQYKAEGGFLHVLEDVVQRQVVEGSVKKHCVDTKFLAGLELFNFPVSGCKAPEGYDSPYWYFESSDNQAYGIVQRDIKPEEQTKPNPTTHKVDKWTGDWKTLAIDYHREKKLKLEMVRVPNE